jgi:histidinol-phosphate aminotransferase
MRLMHLNESPFPASPKVVEAVTAAAANPDTFHRYPDTMAYELSAALSERTGVPAGRIVFGCGSEETLRSAIDIAVEPGDEVVMPAPSFPSYSSLTRQRNGVPVRAPLNEDGANDPEALLKCITPRTRILVCCTPNPPTGGMMGRDALSELISRTPDNVLLLVDEAYYEYGHFAGGADALALLSARRGPWISVRTFSKAYGLAGLRIGYGLCSSDQVADQIRKVRLYYGATTLSQVAALAALKDEQYLSQVLRLVAAERDRLSAGLKALGLKTFPTVTNFVSATLPVAAKHGVEMLRQRRILVRDWRDPEFLNEIRITVGRPDDNDAILAALREILERNGS